MLRLLQGSSLGRKLLELRSYLPQLLLKPIGSLPLPRERNFSNCVEDYSSEGSVLLCLRLFFNQPSSGFQGMPKLGDPDCPYPSREMQACLVWSTWGLRLRGGVPFQPSEAWCVRELW